MTFGKNNISSTPTFATRTTTEDTAIKEAARRELDRRRKKAGPKTIASTTPTERGTLLG